jgi:hypothetical protein
MSSEMSTLIINGVDGMPSDLSVLITYGFNGLKIIIDPMFIFVLILCIGVGIIAKRRGRSFWGWMLLSLIITPIIAGLVIFLIESRPVVKKSPPYM